MDIPKNYAVIGAGNGGRAMAAHLSLMGLQVSLFNRTYNHIAEIKAQGGINLESPEGCPHGFAKIHLVTSNIAEAIKDVKIIMIVLPAFAHAEIAKKLVPHLHDGQIIILHPGRTFGTLEFAKVLRDLNCEVNVILAETETLLYISRSEGTTGVRIFRIKESVPLSAFPSSKTNYVLGALRCSYPQFTNGINILQTGLNNIGAMLHPALTLLNAGRIESTKGNFEFYVDGMTPSVANLINVIDRERVFVASKLGIKVHTLMDWFRISYGVSGKDLRCVILKQVGYAGIKAPSSLNHRYILDDVPNGLVPISSVARSIKISVPGIDTTINLASLIHKTNYWQSGRNLEKLGLANLSSRELIEYVTLGFLK